MSFFSYSVMRRGAGIYQSKKGLSASSLPNVIFTLLICAACWYLGYYYRIGFPVRSNSGTSLLWNFVCTVLTEEKYVYIAGFSLLFLAATFIQRFNFLFVIIKGRTILPFLLFLILNSVNPDFYPIRPVSIALFLLILSLFELFGSYQNPTVTGRMFNIMVYIGAGSLIWPYLLWFIPIFWIGMYQFRILNTRTFLASLTGIFTIFWFVLGWCVWKHDFGVFTNIVQCLLDFRIVFANESWITDWPTPLCFFIFMIGILFYLSLQELESSIRTRHFLSFLFLFGFFSFILSLFYASVFVDFECIFYLSVSIIISYYFSGKYGLATYLFYYLLIALLIVLLFIHLWNFL